MFERYWAARPSYQSAWLAILITHADLWLDLSVSAVQLQVPRPKLS